MQDSDNIHESMPPRTDTYLVVFASDQNFQRFLLLVELLKLDNHARRGVEGLLVYWLAQDQDQAARAHEALELSFYSP